MAVLLQPSEFVNAGFSDFNVIDKEHENRPKKFEDGELQALLDEDDTQTQQMITEQSRQAISDRLRAMGKIHKVG